MQDKKKKAPGDWVVDTTKCVKCPFYKPLMPNCKACYYCLIMGFSRRCHPSKCDLRVRNGEYRRNYERFRKGYIPAAQKEETDEG